MYVIIENFGKPEARVVAASIDDIYKDRHLEMYQRGWPSGDYSLHDWKRVIDQKRTSGSNPYPLLPHARGEKS